MKTFKPEEQPGNSKDDELLAMIAQLGALCHQTNVASFIRSGGLEQAAPTTLDQGGSSSASTADGNSPEVHARLVEQGKKICETLGIPVRATYDPNWRKAIGRAFGKAVPAWQQGPSRPSWSLSRGYDEQDYQDSDPESS